MDIDQWIDDLNSTDPIVVANAKQCLINFGSASVEPLIGAMKRLEGRQCWQAADVLAYVHSDAAFTALTEMLTSKHPIVNQTAARSLETYGARAVQPLIDALPQVSYLTQLRIITSLETLNDQRAVVPLLKLLPAVEDSSLRYTIIQALGVLGDIQALDAIRAYANDPDHHVRSRVERAITRLTSLAP